MNGDWVRRDDVLKILGDEKGIREAVMGLPGKVLPEEQLKLFTKTWSDGRKEYRYGPEWQAMALYVDGGYKTPEEAKLRWLEEWEGRK